MGLVPLEGLRSGPTGSWWELKEDADHFAVQNGGLHNPLEVHMSTGQYYFRFFGSTVMNLHGAEAGMSGWWWIDYETFDQIRTFANRLDWPLSRAASHLLVVPNEWSDCAYVGRALLSRAMHAFAGKGKPASPGMSPDSALRRESGIPVMAGAPHLEIKQYFVPGERELLSAAFQPAGLYHVIKARAPMDF